MESPTFPPREVLAWFAIVVGPVPDAAPLATRAVDVVGTGDAPVRPLAKRYPRTAKPAIARLSLGARAAHGALRWTRCT